MANCCSDLLCTLEHRVQSADAVGCTVDVLEEQEFDCKVGLVFRCHFAKLIVRSMKCFVEC
jgi:hypothetical protein